MLATPLLMSPIFLFFIFFFIVELLVINIWIWILIQSRIQQKDGILIQCIYFYTTLKKSLFQFLLSVLCVLLHIFVQLEHGETLLLNAGTRKARVLYRQVHYSNNHCCEVRKS